MPKSTGKFAEEVIKISGVPVRDRLRWKTENLLLRWLKAVSSTFQDIDFDVSLLPLVIT